MTTRNDITGDKIQTRASTDKFRDGWDRIFASKDQAKHFVAQDSKEIHSYPLPKN